MDASEHHRLAFAAGNCGFRGASRLDQAEAHRASHIPAVAAGVPPDRYSTWLNGEWSPVDANEDDEPRDDRREEAPALDWSFARDEDVVYGTSLVHPDGLVFLPRAWIDRLVAIRKVLRSTPTWGDLRAVLDEEDLEEIRERTQVFLEEDGIAPTDPMNLILDERPVGHIRGVDEFEWPELPDGMMISWIPAEIAHRYAERQTGMIMADQLQVVDEDGFIQGLESVGASCERNDDLIARAFE
jgi:hypothetical protein